MWQLSARIFRCSCVPTPRCTEAGASAWNAVITGCFRVSGVSLPVGCGLPCEVAAYVSGPLLRCATWALGDFAPYAGHEYHQQGASGQPLAARVWYARASVHGLLMACRFAGRPGCLLPQLWYCGWQMDLSLLLCLQAFLCLVAGRGVCDKLCQP